MGLQEGSRCRTPVAALTTSSTAVTMLLTDPLDLAEKADVTLDDLFIALQVMPKEIRLLQTAGQWHNPLWMDVRQ